MKRLASRTAQYPLRAEFAVSYNEFAVDSVTGMKTTFGSSVANSTDPLEPALNAGTGITFDVIPMPVGAVITGGEVIVEAAFVGVGAIVYETVGFGTVSHTGHGPPWLGVLAGLGAGFLYGLAVCYTRRYLVDLPATVLTAGSIGSATIMLAPLASRTRSVS